MRVVIDRKVHEKIQMFYDKAIELHEALDYATVDKKITRLYASVNKLSENATIYRRARVIPEWISKGYREMIHEDFHFAFDIVELEDGECIVYVFDAVHSYLNHE